MSEERIVTGFMCGVDFNYELGQALGGNTIYPTEADLIANKGCTDECGIVEVEVRLKRVIKEEDHSIKPGKTYNVVTRDANGKRSVKTMTGKELLKNRQESFGRRQKAQDELDAQDEPIEGFLE